MTISEDDIDDFDFEEDFAEEWDDDPSDLQFSNDEISDDAGNLPSDDTSEKGADKREYVPKKKNLGVIVPFSIVALLAVGGYFGYTYYMPSSPSVPIVNIPGDDLSSQSIESPAVTKEQDTTLNDNPAVQVMGEPDVTDNVVNEAPITSESYDDVDGVLTPLPDSFEEIDIPLASLSEETLNSDNDQSISNDEDLSNIEDRTTNKSNEDNFFDEQEMLQKTEALPSQEISDVKNEDIFDRIDNMASTPEHDMKISDNDTNVETSIELEPNTSKTEDQSIETSKTKNPSNDTQSSYTSFVPEADQKNTTTSQPEEPEAISTKEKTTPAPAPTLSKPKPVENVKANWKIKAIQPGKAVIRDTISGAVKSVEIGGFIQEIGKITDITKKNGKWVVIGKTGEITQ